MENLSEESETDGVIGTNGDQLACMNPSLRPHFLTDEADR